MDPQKPLSEKESFEPESQPSILEVTPVSKESVPVEPKERPKGKKEFSVTEQLRRQEQTASLEVSVPRASVQVPALVKDRLHREIESVLEEDLTEFYKSLPPEKQKQFHDEGEKTAASIRVLAHQAKKHAKKIFYLIKRWLRLIPGVNRFFLEQEAKIKTDKIVLIVEEEQRRKEQKIT